jgi:hypothetical protein
MTASAQPTPNPKPKNQPMTADHSVLIVDSE